MTEQRDRGPQSPMPGVFGPATMATRLAVRRTLRSLAGEYAGAQSAGQPLLLVALSGGADSLALALALAYEAPRCGVRAGAIIVDHGLQLGSAAVAETAAAQARSMGLSPVLVERVSISSAPGHGGPEASARDARYGAVARVARQTGARAVVTAHTRDDQAEQVLLGLARGSGLRSLAGIPVRRALTAASDLGAFENGVFENGDFDPGVLENGDFGLGVVETRVVEIRDASGGNRGGVLLCRPFLSPGSDAGQSAITRAVTEAACRDQGVEFWRDPHNADPQFARVRVRERVLPMLEAELGPGVAAALARTADLVREDADALDEMAYGIAIGLLGGGYVTTFGAGQHTGVGQDADSDSDSDSGPGTVTVHRTWGSGPLAVAVTDIEGLARPVLNRVIRILAQLRFGAYLERTHTRAIAALVTDWRGQGTVYVPRISVKRESGELHFTAQQGSPRA